MMAGIRLCRVQLIYWWRHGTLANIADPRLFTEHVQRRKLYVRDRRYPQLADKVRVKDHVASQLGGRWLVPTLWRGSRLPAEAAWSMPFVVKSRHGCNQVCVVRDAKGYCEARQRSRKWMRSTYGTWLDEWLYGQIPRGLLVEAYVGNGTTLPLDYKFFVFAGRVRYVQVHLERATNHRWMVFDLNWRRVSLPSEEPDPERPFSFGQMIIAAEQLGANFDFVRADFYEVDKKPLFGELTFYPGSGLDPIEPPALNRAMGSWWSEAETSAYDASRRQSA